MKVRSGGRSYPLTLLFTIVSLAAIGASTWITMNLISRQTREGLIARTVDDASRIAEHLNRLIYENFLFTVADTIGKTDLEDPVQYKILETIVDRAITGFDVESVMWYDRSGTILYSSDRSHVGRSFPDKESIREALDGKTHTELSREGSLSDIDAIPIEHDLLECYFPAHRISRETGEAEEVVGVLEIYQDGRRISREIRAARRRVALITVSTMGSLFLILFFLVLHADRIIQRQTRQIRHHSEVLEELVRARTQELLQAQDKLVETAKLAAVGTLAAGVAHEINNPLASVATCAEGLLSRSRDASFRDDPAFSDFPGYLEIIKKEAFRCKEVTGKLLDFARRRPVEKVRVDLHAVISDVRILLTHHPVVRRGGLLVGEFDHRVLAHPGEIEQVVLNLVQNALDAVADQEDGRVEVTASVHGGNVILSVQDNGTGFSADQKPHLMEPFFTSKKPGKGTGLGLALCHAIAERHGGQITAFSPGPDKGATFKLILPIELMQ